MRSINLGLNMPDYVNATAENYFGRVSKDLILNSLTEVGEVGEVGGEDDRSALLSLKNGVLVKEAETRLQGLHWVPAVMRTEHANPSRLKAQSR